MIQISYLFTWDKIIIIVGIFLQIFSSFMPLLSEKIVPNKTRNKNFSFMSNKVIVRRSLLFLGVFFVSLVVLFESDYVLFVAQCLLFFVLYPKNE